ncbi:MAG: peptide chain release factor N(5)-glutamine methyltransferase, partial [Actinobacteria bacterium]|nr:peptide chain release factor N(5)-glutamine methyltransferase [Actinomycetota bacterium]NIT96748.1 peptide chain release factor N(5)-glutamine methyltransferase [Actinomycetota bacterium]NIV56922.1 peptide chain release factor N(5)-glutamine methyltransferase [Actinomycetota bacterium]NIW29935.1 peptide chain release factor N(5)-glutamine methyltransferase [Actinomycetota bacterium]NIX22433.1 peptide chain release factor N(5)-glutamine methyltransferase [Actinomycetota bacterium]
CREFDRRIARRQAGEPLQYIEGRAAFRELMLRVDPSVLIPRPETEGLVGEVLDWARGRGGLRGLDLGTGSGAIAISLALEGPFERIVGVDISDPALKVAWSNVIETGVGDRVELRSGSLFEALDPDERFDVIVSNPPYIADHEADELPIEVRDWEPSVALYAGPTGSEVIDRIVDGAATHLKPGGLLALEVADGEAASVTARLREGEDYVNARSARDLAGRRRVVMAERR